MNVKRVSIWIAIALTGTGVFIGLHHINQTETEQEGQVTFQHMSGDLVEFLTRKLQQHGVSLALTGSLPAMHAEWRFAEDAKGFQILMAQSHRDELVPCLTQSLGDPIQRDRYPHLVYKEGKLGVSIFADLQSDPIHIICLQRGAL